jgi:hypothetical protein
MHAEYIGCLQHGRPVEHYNLEAKQDADRDMISWQYHAHARKAAYAVSGDAVSVALLPNSEVLRMLQDEGPLLITALSVLLRSLMSCCCVPVMLQLLQRPDQS